VIVRSEVGRTVQIRLVHAVDFEVARAAELTRPVLPVLRFHEQGQDGTEVPAAIASLRPGVVVGPVPPGPGHGIDAPRSAEHLTQRQGNAAMIDVRARFITVAPVVSRADVLHPLRRVPEAFDTFVRSVTRVYAKPPAARARRLTRLLGNGTGVALRFLDETCGLLGDSCGRPELPRRDADVTLEVLASILQACRPTSLPASPELAAGPDGVLRLPVRVVHATLEKNGRWIIGWRLCYPAQAGRVAGFLRGVAFRERGLRPVPYSLLLASLGAQVTRVRRQTTAVRWRLVFRCGARELRVDQSPFL
jgi:hypothetical protein